MNLEDKIKEEVEASYKLKCTTVFLRRLILTIVDQTTSEYYKNVYSMKCLQASAAICMLLHELGIKSEIFVGATCYAKISPVGQPLGWNGFWDQDHHVWVSTEFYELVDLTIRKMHLHPATSIAQLEVPAVWWSNITEWPSVIRYLPEGRLKISLPDKDMLDLENFKARVMEKFERMKMGELPYEPLLWPILLGTDGLQELHNAGNKWLNAALIYQTHGIPLPDWVVQREAELMQRHPCK